MISFNVLAALDSTPPSNRRFLPAWRGQDGLTRQLGFIAFIDEAGDPSVKRVAPLTPGGATEWFVLSAVVVRAAREADPVEWVKELRQDLRATQSAALHYRKLSPAKRLRACEHLGSKPARVFVVASNKRNMEGHQNQRADKISSQEWFYNWCTRILLERVTSYCFDVSMREVGEPQIVRLEFSQRGGLRYDQMRAYHKYLELQDRGPRGVYLNRRRPKWEVMSWDEFCVYPDHQRAGLQLADIAASAFYQAVEPQSPHFDLNPAKALSKVVARVNGTPVDEGLTLLPFASQGRNLTDEQCAIFRHYKFDL